MLRAICVSCGQAKKRPSVKCKACQFDPAGDDAALVRSVYLSAERLDGPHEQAAYARELAILQKCIRSGGALDFDPQELERLANQLRPLRAVPSRAPWLGLIRLFAPAVLILTVVAGAVWLTRRVTDESDAAIRHAECVVELTHAASNIATPPPPCVALSASELERTKAEAQCVLLRRQTQARGVDPDSACRLQFSTAPSH